MIHPSQLLHTALLVRDLSRAETFYSQVLGLEKLERSLSYPGAWYRIGGGQIHLIVTDAPLPIADHRSNHPKWGRRPHLALAISDLEAAIAKLEAVGCPLQMSSSGRRALFVQDPDGNVIELTEQAAQPSAPD
ncbi:MAG: VOC family protein [Cyanobacteria bacterium P01_A01_bin.135]